ncbi:MAG: hypothetical protein ABFD07_08315 [Methanobacterium sp.]
MNHLKAYAEALKQFRHKINIAANIGEICCGGKKKYDTRRGANRAIKDKAQKESHAYFCPYCLHWHVGRKMRPEEKDFPMKLSWDEVFEIIDLVK